MIGAEPPCLAAANDNGSVKTWRRIDGVMLTVARLQILAPEALAECMAKAANDNAHDATAKP